MSTSSKWIDSRVEVLSTEVSDLVTSMPRFSAVGPVRSSVATQLRIEKATARPYPSDGAGKGLAGAVVGAHRAY